MTTQGNYVRVLNAALAEFQDESGETKIVLRGVIDTSTIRHMLTDDYQREALPLSQLKSIISAYAKRETVPDIELGMRGQKYREIKDGVFNLHDPVYIIDGLQRTSGAKLFMMNNPEVPLHIGATIHFGTTKEWERERFRILNSKRLRVSSNILLRNKREESRAVGSLFGLSANDKGFVLHDKINWEQNKRRGDYISAMTFARVVGTLHSHKSPGRSAAVDAIVPQLDKAAEVFGLQIVRDNTKMFFELVDECWGLRHVKYKERAPQIRHTFLLVFARVVSDCKDFWKNDEKRLFVESQLRRKFATFKLLEPYIEHLCGSGGKAGEELYSQMRGHLNKGKRTKKLSFRNSFGPLSVPEHDEEFEDEQSSAVNGTGVAA